MIRHSFVTRLLAVTLVVGLVRTAHTAPGDVLQLPAPVLGAGPPKEAALHDGDASVSTQTGALQYSYPIEVPPGRLGNEPHLALSYSSQAPLFGGIAAGWSLSIPEIRLDTSKGILAQQFGVQMNPNAIRFISTMAGSRPLIEVTDPHGAGVDKTYRAQNDASFGRYEHMLPGQAYAWRVFATDGTIYYFGDTSLLTGPSWNGDVIPLTRTEDSFGNRVEYQWDSTYGNDPHIVEIRYTSNPAASLPAFAKVDFTWSPQPACAGAPVGAANDYRSGYRHYFGANKLTQIVATAFDPATNAVQHTRQITLGYSSESESCTAKHGPVRLLTSIQESAWGPNAQRVDLPAVTFAYGDTTNAPTLTTTVNSWSGEPALTSGNRHFDGRWPGVDSMMLDFDGDGLVDHLQMANPGAPDCTFDFWKNTGNGFVKKLAGIQLPTLGWGVPGHPNSQTSAARSAASSR